MPRESLRAIDGARQRFTARIARRGEKPGWRKPVPTLLLTDIADWNTGQPLTDHLWIADGKWSARIADGTAIAFDARVGSYRKGYRGRRADAYDAPPPSIDWKLERPTRVQVRDADTGAWTAAPTWSKSDPAPKLSEPATIAQLCYLSVLRKSGPQPAPKLDEALTKEQASALISELVASVPRPQCVGKTQSGARCSRQIGYGEEYCGEHGPAAKRALESEPKREHVIPANRCRGTTQSGAQCRKEAMRLDYCWMHEKQAPPPAPPPTEPRCQGRRPNGKRCNLTAKAGKFYCKQHKRSGPAADDPAPDAQVAVRLRCLGLEVDGSQCAGQPRRGRDFCRRHQDNPISDRPKTVQAGWQTPLPGSVLLPVSSPTAVPQGGIAV